MNLYSEAAQFIDVSGKGGSIRSIIYNAYEKNKGKLKCEPKRVCALVIETLKYRSILEELIKNSQLLKFEKKLKLPIALLMVHDLLLSKGGRIQVGHHHLKDAVLRHKTRLKAELVKYKLKHGVQDLSETIVEDESMWLSVAFKQFGSMLTPAPVRWIRRNTIKCKEDLLETSLSHLRRVGSIDEIEKGTVFVDNCVCDLYGVHPSEPITKSEAYENGHIIIQDRASCFPAAILNPQPGDVLIDACAAPGNKTTHLAMLVQGNPGSITAFERDPKRANILRGMVARAGADKCVSVVCDDFTNTNPEDFVEVTGMVVDPSCSGSGIFGRGFDESAKDDSHDQTRLFKLQEFQTKIMSHALSFPNIQTVVYSTCSIHPEENEHVVRRLLEDSRFAKRFRVRPRSKVLPGWHRRGWPNAFAGRPDAKELADACVRAVPREDGGIGFFAVCFERIPGSQNLPTGEQSDHTHEDSNNDDYDEDEDEWAGFD